MLFNSLEFLIFFPIVLLVYFLIPRKIKQVWLLVASYYFYMCWNAKYALLILTVTIVTYVSGLALERAKKSEREETDVRKIKNLIVFLSFAVDLGLLFYFKYTNFAISMLTAIFGKVGINLNLPVFDIILPVGISFYTFQALSYTMDVYRDEIYAEKNFIKYALFVSFFPQLVAGPIERSKNLLKQLDEPKKFNFDLAREGFLLMLWGFFLKIVLADRIAIFVDTVYGNTGEYKGWYVIVATVLFAIQIYCDFAGYSTVAIGAAKVLGVELMENFDAPYLATNVADFWRRWHISLTSWFKDYLYIPLGGSRKGKVRKQINKMIVFLVSGLWHGASISFVVWGGINGLYQVVGELLMPLRVKVRSLLNIDTRAIGYRILSGLATFIMVDFAWLFFRAGSFGTSQMLVQEVFNAENPWIFYDGSLYNCGLDRGNFMVMLIAMGILLFADICKNRGIKIREVVIRQDYWFRWLFISVSIALILTFGVWGASYNAASFIYFQF